MVRFCLDARESELELVRLLRSAQVHVFYSSFVMHVHKELLPGVTLISLFRELNERNVHVYMLYNEETAYGNLPVQDLVATLPPNVHVNVVVGSGQVKPWLAKLLRLQNTRYSNHHQKYIMVDDAEIMITGVDVTQERQAWLNKNDHGYVWHEISVVLPCSPAIAAFARANFAALVDTPPFPLTSGFWEYKLLMRMIATARDYVHMEQQTCVSAGTTANKIFDCVAHRVARAYQHRDIDPFCFILITNKYNPDEPEFLNFFLTQQLSWSGRYLQGRCASLGVPRSFTRQRVFVGELVAPNKTPVKIHSNFTIADGTRMLRASSNLSDRSMSVFPCDSELGVAVHDEPAVTQLQRTLWSRYLFPHAPSTAQEALQLMATNLFMPRAIRASPAGVLLNPLCDIINLTNAFGGKKQITWSIHTVS